MTIAYVNSRLGVDTASGSQSSPLKTIGHVNSLALKPGDQILLCGGLDYPDAQLMPGKSGSVSAPITFGMYGSTDKPRITQGFWAHQSYLSLVGLQFGNTVQGGAEESETGAVGFNANSWKLTNCDIFMPAGNQELGLIAVGNGWAVSGGSIHDTGLSSIYCVGDSHSYSGMLLDTFGTYNVGYNAHGVYGKVSHLTVTACNIGHGKSSGVSCRFRDSTVTFNEIYDVATGIDFFEYDTLAGTSVWTDNTISSSVAGIYTNTDVPLIESFTIKRNDIKPGAGVKMDLGKTSGKYILA